MSGDQDADKPAEDEDIDKVLRDAEEAVAKVRGGEAAAANPGGGANAGEDDPPEDDDPSPEQLLEEARAENEALRDKWLRAVADHDNYKKRVKRDIDDAVHRAVQTLLSSFLPVGDNLERAMSAVPKDVDENLLKGLDMVRQEFYGALGKHGIKPVPAVGQPFDPNVHDALQQVDSPDYAPGVVVMEYEKGYMRGEKLLRPARVIVAGPGSTGTAGAPEPSADDAGAAGEAN